MDSRKDVIVLGAGISGLACAKLLKEQYGLNVVVLEARDRVGGRTYTTRDPSYQYTDLGGAYIGPTQRRVARLAEELGLEFYKINLKEKSINDVEGSRTLFYGTTPLILNPIRLLDLNHAQRTVDSMANQVPPEAPWKATKAAEWDKTTFQDFIDKICWTNFTKKLMTLMCKAVLATEPCEVSLLYFLWYFSSGQGVQRLLNIKNGAQERKFVGGAMQLSEKMADKLGSVVKLSEPVIKVEQGQGKDAGVKVTCADGKQYEAAYVVSSVPLALLNRITFEPPLPSRKIQLIQRVPMGSVIKTMTFYDKAYWKEKGLCGQMACDRGPVIYCMDDTKPDGSFPCIMGFILANEAREMVSMSVEERKNVVTKHYADLFKCKELLKPSNYVEKNWMEEEYSGGCYVSFMPPGLMTALGSVIREPFDKVYFAGTECATYWAGYMEGAIESGERAAREIMHVKGKLPASEIWQDEPPSALFPEKGFPGERVEKLLPTVGGLLWTLGAVLTAGAAWLMHRYLTFDLDMKAGWRN